MSSKNNAEVAIGGKIYTVCGYESEEYLQKVAAHINNKLQEVNSNDAARRLTADYKTMVMYLNLADDYFKAKQLGDSLQTEADNKEKQIYDLKHELIAAQIKIDSLTKEKQELKEQLEKMKAHETEE